LITCVLEVFLENMTASNRKNIRISVKKHKFVLNEQNDAEEFADQGEEQADNAAEKAENRKKRKKKADIILQFVDKSEGEYEKRIFKAIKSVNDSKSFNDFMRITNKVFATSAQKVQGFSNRVLGKPDFLIGKAPIQVIRGELDDLTDKHKDELDSLGAEWNLEENIQEAEQDTPKVDPNVQKAFKNIKKDYEDREYRQSGASELEFTEEAIDLARKASTWLKMFNQNFKDMGSAFEKKKLDVIEVFSQPINAGMLTEMRLIYAICVMLSKFSAVGERDITGPEQYHKVLNSKFLYKWFESGRRNFDKSFKVFLNAGFATATLDKFGAKKAMRSPVDYKKMSAIMKGDQSLEESILGVQKIIEAVGGRYRPHMSSGNENTGKPQENFYDRLKRGGDLRTIFDCWADSKTDKKTGKPGLGDFARTKFLGALRSSREEKVLNYIEKMNKQVMGLGVDCKDGGPGPGNFPVKPGQPGGPTGPGGDPDGGGGGTGSKFAVPVFKKHSGKEQEAGAPPRSLASQLAKVFPDVPKSAISQILKDIAKQLKSQNINIQENKEVIAKILLEKARKSGRNDLFRQHKKALEDALQSKKPTAGKLRFVDNKAVVADNIWTGQRADGSRKEFNLSDYEGKTRKAQSKQARNAALCWAGDKEYCKEEDNSLFNRFKEILRILDLHTPEGRKAASQTDEAYLGAYRFYKAMNLALGGIKTGRLEDRTGKIEKILQPLNEQEEPTENSEFQRWLETYIKYFKIAGLVDSDRAMKASRSARGVKDQETGPEDTGLHKDDTRNTGRTTKGKVNSRQSVGPNLKAAGININSPEGQKIHKRMLKVIRRFLNKNMQRIGKQDMKVISERVLNEMKVRGIISESMPISVKPNITDETDQDMSQLIDMAYDFYPYSQQRLGFDKPAGIKLTSDPDNASNPLGKTAHYDPENYEIVLYVDNRHPKDLMRSLSHELVHHAQNCRGDFDKLTDTGPGYAQKDPHLRKMEAEAYLMGNGFLFRDWEDSIKENNKMLSETQIRKMVRDGLKKVLFESSELQEDDVQEETVEEACGDHDELEEGSYYKRDDLDERRKSADGSEAAGHGRGREGEDVANSARLEEADDVSEELDEETIEEHQAEDAMTAILDEYVATKEEVTVESRLRDKNDFLFEKLSKMWTK